MSRAILTISALRAAPTTVLVSSSTTVIFSPASRPLSGSATADMFFSMQIRSCTRRKRAPAGWVGSHSCSTDQLSDAQFPSFNRSDPTFIGILLSSIRKQLRKIGEGVNIVCFGCLAGKALAKGRKDSAHRAKVLKQSTVHSGDSMCCRSLMESSRHVLSLTNSKTFNETTKLSPTVRRFH